MTNRLADAISPYLRQHADNPVHWWQWEPGAFDEARRRDVPILLSVGYAACHWCHVMAHESFEDEGTAQYLNDHFVSIKVDREERPDVDAVYMRATTAMTGQGGWPMTVILDHGGAPFFAGTYFPPAQRGNHPSFMQVLTAVTDAWTQRREDVTESASALRQHLSQDPALQPVALEPDLLDGAVRTLQEEFDEAAAGFGSAPKFPPSMICDFLDRHHRRTGWEQSRRLLSATTEAMARGGIYDQLGGGFARYAVDRHWVVPHFEKMLYDNALLLEVYAHLEGDLGRRITRETADFLLAELRTGDGGFASALDADSEGREGAFYVWTPDQLEQVLGPDDAPWAAHVFGVTPAGTFENGASTLQRRHDPDDPERLDRIRDALLVARADRPRPERDDKVVAAWNGLAISALVAAAQSSGDGRYLDAALAAGRLLARVHLVDGRLRRVSRDGVAAAAAGVAEDYGGVADAFICLAAATGEADWLDRAGELLRVAVAHFAAPDGGFYDTADDAEALIGRPREVTDNAYPSGQAAIGRALIRYHALTGELGDPADAALSAMLPIARQAPRFAGWVLGTAELVASGPEAVAVLGAAGPQRDALVAAAHRRRPAAVVVAEADQGDIPLLAGRGPVDGAPAAYVCRDQVCELPVTDPEALALPSR